MRHRLRFSFAGAAPPPVLRPPRRLVELRGRQATALAAGLLTAFAGLFAIVRANRSLDVDIAVMIRVQRVRWPWFAQAMKLVSWPGFAPQSRLIPPGIAIALWLLRLRKEGAFAALAWGTALLSTIVKSRMRRPRPADPSIQVVVAKLAGSSFPSGHTLAYVGVYGFAAYLAYTLIRPRLLRRTAVTLLVSLVALVGPSRVYEGHHWPTDVLASYLLGVSYLLGLTALYRRLREMKHPARAAGVRVARS